MQPGEIIVKIIEGAGSRTASFERVKDVRDGIIYLGDASEPDDVNAYSERTGHAKVNYIPGFRSYLASLDGGEEDKIKTEMVK